MGAPADLQTSRLTARSGTTGTVEPGEYAFILDDSEFTVVRDAAGASLLATIWGRIPEYNVDSPNAEQHPYNDSPGSSGLPWLGHRR